MRILVTLLCLAPLFAQQQPEGAARPKRPEPKNLKLLEPTNLIPTMRAISAALGVECNHCHVQGNFASDEKPQKEVARKMIVMARDINAKYFDAKMQVTCFTCHRGATEPLTAPAGAAPAAHPPAASAEHPPAR